MEDKMEDKIESSNKPAGLGNSTSGNEQIMAISSIIFGAMGFCLVFFLGFCGVPFSAISLVLGLLAMKNPDVRILAVIGVTISGISLLLICLILVMFGGLTIMGPVIENVFEGINQRIAP
jgi:hypothetical protein